MPVTASTSGGPAAGAGRCPLARPATRRRTARSGSSCRGPAPAPSLGRKVEAGGGHDLRQQAREEDDHLGVAEVAQEPLAQRPVGSGAGRAVSAGDGVRGRRASPCRPERRRTEVVRGTPRRPCERRRRRVPTRPGERSSRRSPRPSRRIGRLRRRPRSRRRQVGRPSACSGSSERCPDRGVAMTASEIAKNAARLPSMASDAQPLKTRWTSLRPATRASMSSRVE